VSEVRQSVDLSVITEAKKLTSLVFSITDKSPKKFRFTFVSRLQNLALDIVESLFRANDTYFARDSSQHQLAERLELQHGAATSARLVGYIAMLSLDQQCILPKQFEQISEAVDVCQARLASWVASDRRRLAGWAVG
jgi:hypothetical protein